MVDGPVRQASLREHNLALVLRQVAGAARPPSRADVSAVTGLTRATVSALVDDLIAGNLLAEVDPAPRARAGRPAAGLVLARNGPAGLGLEVNIDYLAACVVDLAGTVRHHRVRRADQRPRVAHEVLADLAELADHARFAAEREGVVLAGAAVAVPGLVGDDGGSGGIVRLAPNLGWRDVVVPDALDLPLPVTVDNEANLAALGELHAGPQGPASFLYVSGEIGVGAGIVLNGALYRGARGWSGELGHVAVRPDGPACRCGARGCLERYAGQEAILRAAGAATVDDVISRAERDDPATRRALADAGAALGVAVAGVVNVLDVGTVVLGGAYAPLAPWLSPAVEDEIHRRVLTAAWSPVSVRPSRLGERAAVVGAAGSVVREIRDHPARWLTGRAPVPVPSPTGEPATRADA